MPNHTEDRYARFVNELNEVTARQTGWLDGTGEPVNIHALDATVTAVNIANERHGMPLPWLSSTADGNVALQWSGDRWIISGETAHPDDGTVTDLELVATSISADGHNTAFTVVQLLTATGPADLAAFVAANSR